MEGIEEFYAWAQMLKDGPDPEGQLVLRAASSADVVTGAALALLFLARAVALETDRTVEQVGEMLCNADRDEAFGSKPRLRLVRRLDEDLEPPDISSGQPVDAP